MLYDDLGHAKYASPDLRGPRAALEQVETRLQQVRYEVKWHTLITRTGNDILSTNAELQLTM